MPVVNVGAKSSKFTRFRDQSGKMQTAERTVLNRK